MFPFTPLKLLVISGILSRQTLPFIPCLPLLISPPHFLSSFLPSASPETALLSMQLITVTVGPNCSIISHVISHPCDIKILTMMVKSRETDAIYHSETLCSHTVLDKVWTGNRMAAIVKTHVISQHFSGNNCFLT